MVVILRVATIVRVTLLMSRINTSHFFPGITAFLYKFLDAHYFFCLLKNINDRTG